MLTSFEPPHCAVGCPPIAEELFSRFETRGVAQITGQGEHLRAKPPVRDGPPVTPRLPVNHSLEELQDEVLCRPDKISFYLFKFVCLFPCLFVFCSFICH